MDYEQEFIRMEERLTDIEGRIEVIGNSVREVRDALLGTEFSGNKGWIKEIEYLKKKVEEHDEFKKKVIWACLGIGVVFTVVQVLIQTYLSIKK